jgi:5-methylcytosine-specific restriction endonuclease McrA
LRPNWKPPERFCERCGKRIEGIQGRKYCDDCRSIAYIEKRREQCSRWRKLNRERYLSARRKNYWVRREHYLQRNRLYVKAHLSRYREHFRRWRKAHPDWVREVNRRRRVRERNASGYHTYEQFLEVLARQNFRCYYCGAVLTEQTAQEDHFIPLSRGGSDDISNIVAACRACNSGKRDRNPWEFMLTKTGDLACAG